MGYIGVDILFGFLFFQVHLGVSSGMWCLQPFVSFLVCCGLWQALARYLNQTSCAFSNGYIVHSFPLQQDTLDDFVEENTFVCRFYVSLYFGVKSTIVKCGISFCYRLEPLRSVHHRRCEQRSKKVKVFWYVGFLDLLRCNVLVGLVVDGLFCLVCSLCNLLVCSACLTVLRTSTLDLWLVDIWYNFLSCWIFILVIVLVGGFQTRYTGFARKNMIGVGRNSWSFPKYWMVLQLPILLSLKPKSRLSGLCHSMILPKLEC